MIFDIIDFLILSFFSFVIFLHPSLAGGNVIFD